eukprot:TRINITY_DN1243_c0_g1_i1.p1 TRINITY_DN1243_c0_g1~~TRINITY_DN1243_c0_g1_i1.p1  ORF type:complete len:285 (+),score=73.61 TRINITY_DN1243_c0_g1_i1:48-902(+)
MGNAHAVAAKRLPAVVQQNPHTRTATAASASGNLPFPGLVGAGIFGSGIHQAAAAARAAVNAANSVVDAALCLDHDDGLRVEVQAIEASTNASENVVHNLSAAIQGPEGYNLFGSHSNNVASLFSDRIWLPRVVRNSAYVDDLHFTTPTMDLISKSDHSAAALSSLGLATSSNETVSTNGNSGRCPEASAAASWRKIVKRPVVPLIEKNPFKLDPLVREQRFAIDETMDAFVSPSSASADSSASFSHAIPGIGIVVFVGALIYSVVPVHHAELLQEILFSPLDA